MILVRIDHTVGVDWTFLIFLVHKHELGKVSVRLSQMKRFWLQTFIVTTASLAFKDIFFWREEVVGVW